jgi:hypothetical protein
VWRINLETKNFRIDTTSVSATLLVPSDLLMEAIQEFSGRDAEIHLEWREERGRYKMLGHGYDKMLRPRYQDIIGSERELI